jgi:hypothetical protein
MNHNNLEPMNSESLDDELPAEYDADRLRDLLRNGVRGKYVERCEPESIDELTDYFSASSTDRN